MLLLLINGRTVDSIKGKWVLKFIETEIHNPQLNKYEQKLFFEIVDTRSIEKQ